MKTRYKQIIQIQRCLVGECSHEVKVTRINGNYHVRVFLNGSLNQEAVTYDRSDIAYTCKTLLRWEDKCGNISQFASSARERLNRKN